MPITPAQILVVLICAMLAGVLSVALRLRAPAPVKDSGEIKTVPDLNFLFEGQTLVHTNAPALIRPLSADDTDWTALTRRLAPRFSEFPAENPMAASAGKTPMLTYVSDLTADSGLVEITDLGAQTRVLVKQSLPENLGEMLHDSIEGVLQSNRFEHLVENAPAPIWHVNPDGGIDYANAAYRALCRMARYTDVASDELVHLFAEPDRSRSGVPVRQSIVTRTGEKPHWFDIYSLPHACGTQHYAIDVNAVVNAAVAQRNFVQTLAKTFAQLSIGLAIFDRNRQLALFNPALINLTKMPVEFLSTRPALISFFDHMRESNMMPEPKNYPTWRDNISRLAEEARDGTYTEIWSLSSGLTYKVTGRPHPDGALAFLFEDISEEIRVTRDFRAELDLCRSAVDAMEEAVVIFTTNGAVSLGNRRFQHLWDIKDKAQLERSTIVDCCEIWAKTCEPSDAWDEINALVTGARSRAPRTYRLATRNGLSLLCTATPIAVGGTMVSFRTVGAMPADAKALNRVTTSS